MRVAVGAGRNRHKPDIFAFAWGEGDAISAPTSGVTWAILLSRRSTWGQIFMAAPAVPEADAAIAAEPELRRRDVINIAAVAFAGVGIIPIAGVAINQMNPSADVLAALTTEVDISKIEVGQAIKTIFQKQPLFVRHLTPVEIVPPLR